MLGGTAAGLLLQRPSWAADTPGVDLNSYTPMDALKGKDYGKPRIK